MTRMQPKQDELWNTTVHKLGENNVQHSVFCLTASLQPFDFQVHVYLNG